MQNEVKLLLELLPKYYAHVERYPHTLLIKFYGLHRVVPLNGSKVEVAHIPISAHSKHSSGSQLLFSAKKHMLGSHENGFLISRKV